MTKKIRKNKQESSSKSPKKVKNVKMYGIYWYTFPSLFKEEGEFPIKIGVSTNGKHPKNRILQQRTSMPEKPKVLGVHFHRKAKKLEKYLHEVFTKLGKHKDDAGGTEWFIVSHLDIEIYILKFEQEHINHDSVFNVAELLEPIKTTLIEDKKKQLETQNKVKRKKELRDPYYDEWTQTQKQLYIEKNITIPIKS